MKSSLAGIHVSPSGRGSVDDCSSAIDRPRQADLAAGRPGAHVGRVIVVDDDPDSGILVRLLLNREDFDVEVAADGEQLLERDLSSVQLILLDLNLPTLDGEATARALRSRGFVGAIVAYTGAECSRQKLEQVGFTDYLSKDSPVRKLIALCRRYSSAEPAAEVPDAPGRERFDSRQRREIQRSYVEGLFESIDTLRRTTSTGLYRQAAAVAHRLAGTGGLYDLPAVSDYGRQLYDALDRHALPIELSALIDRLEIEAQAAAAID